MVLTWDQRNWLYLLNRDGKRQGQVRIPGSLTAAACAEDGSAYAGCGEQGDVWWLAPDLTTRWVRSVGARATALALDPFGQYVAVADHRSRVHTFDRHGQAGFEAACPHPLQHLAFVPGEPFLLGAGEYGLVLCFDWSGQVVWRDALVASIGSLAVSGDGEEIVCACFTDGLRRYNLAGKGLERRGVGEACRLAAVSFAGDRILTATLSQRLLLLDAAGQVGARHALEQAPVGIALSALGDRVLVGQADGTVLCLETGSGSREIRGC